MNRSTGKLLAISLDGACIDYIRSRAESLPTLKRCLGNGRLYLPDPPRGLSGSVWPTFYTGTSPGEHGIYQHLVWDPRRMGIRRISPDHCDSPPFWRTLDAQGKRCVVLDVPYSFSQPLRNGVVITDWATHGQTWPTKATSTKVEALLRDIGDSPMGRETPVRKTPGQLDRIRRRLLNSAELKGDLVAALMQQLDWDVLITVFAETHRGGHTLWSEADGDTGVIDTPLLSVYRAVDAALNRILRCVNDDDTTIVIFSVHGMMPDYNQTHLVRPLLENLNRVFTLQCCGLPPSRRTAGGLVRALRAAVPARLQHAAGDAAGDRLRQWVVEQEMVGGLDWSRTPGFALRTDIRTELRLNLQGRESRGMLAPGSALHRQYVEWIREVFLGLVDADTGAHLVEDVIQPPALFPGPRSKQLPDLVATWRAEPPARRVTAPRIGEMQIEPDPVRGGDHTDQGFALLLDSLADDRFTPPLTRTDEFARFLTHLASREHVAEPVAASL